MSQSNIACFQCNDSHTPLYCLNCAERILMNPCLTPVQSQVETSELRAWQAAFPVHSAGSYRRRYDAMRHRLEELGQAVWLGQNEQGSTLDSPPN